METILRAAKKKKKHWFHQTERLTFTFSMFPHMLCLYVTFVCGSDFIFFVQLESYYFKPIFTYMYFTTISLKHSC